MHNIIWAVFFDFGGVIAEEGFYHGLIALANKNALAPSAFFAAVDRIIYDTGYLIGKTDETTFWNAVRRETGILGSDIELRSEILNRFTLRPDMIAAVDALRSKGLLVVMLSDQTDWLEKIDQMTGLFRHFDRVFNSFRMQKSKRDASVFRDVCATLGVKPEETLFVDDNIGHINRAQEQGLQTIHFTGLGEYEKEMESLWKKGIFLGLKREA